MSAQLGPQPSQQGLTPPATALRQPRSTAVLWGDAASAAAGDAHEEDAAAGGVSMAAGSVQGHEHAASASTAAASMPPKAAGKGKGTACGFQTGMQPQLASEEASQAGLLASAGEGGAPAVERSSGVEQQAAPQLQQPTPGEVACIPMPSLPPLPAAACLQAAPPGRWTATALHQEEDVVGALMARLERVWQVLGLTASQGMELVLRWVRAGDG